MVAKRRRARGKIGQTLLLGVGRPRATGPSRTIFTVGETPDETTSRVVCGARSVVIVRRWLRLKGPDVTKSVSEEVKKKTMEEQQKKARMMGQKGAGGAIPGGAAPGGAAPGGAAPGGAVPGGAAPGGAAPGGATK